MDANWRNKLLVCKTVTDGAGTEVWFRRRDGDPGGADPGAPDLLALFAISELEYYTDDELAEHPDRKATTMAAYDAKLRVCAATTTAAGCRTSRWT